MENFPHLPTILLIAGAVLALVFILNRWLFGPLNAILAQRQAEIDDARDEFEAAQRVQNERLAAVEARVAESRRESYGIREQAQGEARERREQILAAAREDAAKEIEAARAVIGRQIEAARTQLESDADGIARTIAERILGRPVDVDADGASK
jgi:F-type H+-transporting ATPase subunit b